MSKLFNLLFGKPEIKGEIHLKIDKSKEEVLTKVEGNMPTVLTLISVLANKLYESGVPKELIKGAIDIGCKEESTKRKDKAKIIEKEIVIDNEEKANKIKKFLEELEEK